MTGTYLPNSMKEIDCQDELLVLLWKFLLHNPGARDSSYDRFHRLSVPTPMFYGADRLHPGCSFIPCLLSQIGTNWRADFLAFAKMNRPAGLNILLEAVCFFICANMADPAKASLVHICIFTLLLFSGEREFSVALNDPLTNVIPASIASGGAICTTCAFARVAPLPTPAEDKRKDRAGRESTSGEHTLILFKGRCPHPSGGAERACFTDTPICSCLLYTNLWWMAAKASLRSAPAALPSLRMSLLVRAATRYSGALFVTCPAG
eukprot:SAG11_NODE_1378_length_5084_cov_3.339619_5_plen_264_part_00